MKNQTKIGLWNLPNIKSSLSGKLFINYDKKEITLKLFSKIYLNEEPINFNLDNRTNQNHFELILGKSNHEKTTLFNCSMKRIEPISNVLYELTYRIEFVFSNIHLNKISDLIVHKSNIHYPFLSTFIDGWDSTENFLSDKKEYTNHSETYNIGDNLNLTFGSSYFKSKIKMDGGYEMKFSKYSLFEYPEGKQFLETLRDYNIFSKILSFSTSKDICFKVESLWIPKGKIKYDDMFLSKNNEVYCIVYNFSKQDSCNVEKSQLHQNFMLFSRWNMNIDQLTDIIKRWYKNTHLLPIYDFYIDSNNWFEGKGVILSNVMFNNRFLNLVQGLESYYDTLDIEYIEKNEEFTKKRQLIIDQLENDDLKNWLLKTLKFPRSITLSKKLENLIMKFTSIFEGLVIGNGFMNKFTIKTSDYRHKLSHGRIDKTFQGRDFNKLYYFSQIMLCICILDSLNIEHDKIKKIITSNENMKRKVSNLLK